MDETADPSPAGGGKQIGRPCDIARLEPGAVGCIDYACDVDDRVGPVAKPVEAGRIFQRSGDPLYAIA
jgi:hypothetical protein